MADERRVRRLLADRAAVLTELLRDEDADRAERVTEVMLQMQTLDIATLEEADAGQLWWPSWPLERRSTWCASSITVVSVASD